MFMFLVKLPKIEHQDQELERRQDKRRCMMRVSRAATLPEMCLECLLIVIDAHLGIFHLISNFLLYITLLQF